MHAHKHTDFFKKIIHKVLSIIIEKEYRKFALPEYISISASNKRKEKHFNLSEFVRFTVFLFSILRFFARTDKYLQLPTTKEQTLIANIVPTSSNKTRIYNKRVNAKNHKYKT